MTFIFLQEGNEKYLREFSFFALLGHYLLVSTRITTNKEHTTPSGKNPQIIHSETTLLPTAARGLPAGPAQHSTGRLVFRCTFC
jgi:hypothetical protein